MCFFLKTIISPCKSQSSSRVSNELLSPNCLTWRHVMVPAGRKSLHCPLVARRNDHIWSCLCHQNREAHGAFCSINRCASVLVLNTIWQSSDFPSQDCEKPGISCLTMHCNLSALAKEESRSIDIYMLLNTEILKKVSPEELHSRGSFKSVWIAFLMKLCLPLLKLSWHVPLVIRLLKDTRGHTRSLLFSVIRGPVVLASPGSLLDMQNLGLHPIPA